MRLCICPPTGRDGLSEFALIDKDGFILRPARGRASSRCRWSSGIRETETDRRPARARAPRACDARRTSASLAGHISEVDVSDPNNLVVAEHVDNRVVNLMIGDENYSARMSNFLNNYNEIRMKRPDATTFDLRVDDMITVVGDQDNGK